MEVLSTLTGVGLPGGGGSATVDEITLDFGNTVPVWSKTFTFTVSGAAVGQKIVMSAQAQDDGESEMDGFACAARVVSSNTVEASIQAVPGPVMGQHKFNLIRG